MKISVLGSGRWGSFIAWYLSLMDETVLWGRESSQGFQTLKNSRTNGTVTFGERTVITSDINEALKNDTIVISISSQNLRSFAKELSDIAGDRHRRFILCMKGLEEGTGKRLTEVFHESYTKSHDVAVWVGPGHVEDFVQAIPNCMLIDSENESFKEGLASVLSSSLIRFYYGNDLVGSEVGAASKNVIGIAAGMLDGLGVSSLKGALMARGQVKYQGSLMQWAVTSFPHTDFPTLAITRLPSFQSTLITEPSVKALFAVKNLKSLQRA